MKHLDVLNIICKNKKLINEAYLNSKVISVNEELLEIGLFHKIGDFYYINQAYKDFIDTLLKRADFDYIIEDLEKEIQRVLTLKEEYENERSHFVLENLKKMTLKIFQEMKNRDDRVASLLQKLEKDSSTNLELLIKEAKRILEDIELASLNNIKIINTFNELKQIDELNKIVKSINYDIVKLNENIDFYLKRLKEFISQTEKKRAFNKKLQKIAHMILNEDSEIDKFLASKDSVTKVNINTYADIIEPKKVKTFFNNISIKKEVKKETIKRKELKEVIELININRLIEHIKGSEDIYTSIISYLQFKKELLNESVRIFVYILNNYDKHIVYTDKFNKFNVRIVKWK